MEYLPDEAEKVLLQHTGVHMARLQERQAKDCRVVGHTRRLHTGGRKQEGGHSAELEHVAEAAERPHHGGEGARQGSVDNRQVVKNSFAIWQHIAVWWRI